LKVLTIKQELLHFYIIQPTQRFWTDVCENVCISLQVFSWQNPSIDSFIFLLSACGWNRKAIAVEEASNREYVWLKQLDSLVSHVLKMEGIQEGVKSSNHSCVKTSYTKRNRDRTVRQRQSTLANDEEPKPNPTAAKTPPSPVSSPHPTFKSPPNPPPPIPLSHTIVGMPRQVKINLPWNRPFRAASRHRVFCFTAKVKQNCNLSKDKLWNKMKKSVVLQIWGFCGDESLDYSPLNKMPCGLVCGNQRCWETFCLQLQDRRKLWQKVNLRNTYPPTEYSVFYHREQ
jgi:hypothetical protein